MNNLGSAEKQDFCAGDCMVIRSFGKEIACSDVDDVERQLRKECRGLSVAVHFTRASGVRAFVCVDVPDDMSQPIVHSYSDKAFDYSSFY